MVGCIYAVHVGLVCEMVVVVIGEERDGGCGLRDEMDGMPEGMPEDSVDVLPYVENHSFSCIVPPIVLG